MLYGALDIASRKTSEKDSHRPLLDEWADVVTDARNLVKNLVWRDGEAHTGPEKRPPTPQAA